MPGIARIVQQISNGEDVVVYGYVDHSVLHVVRVEVDDRQERSATAGWRLAVGNDLGVVGVVKSQRRVELQRRVRTPDLVDAAEQLADVARPLPVPLPE